MREYKGADATAVLRRGDSCKLRAVERDIGLSAVRDTLQYYVLICHSILTFFFFTLVFYFRENHKLSP
jgi:hypothetical protein